MTRFRILAALASLQLTTVAIAAPSWSDPVPPDAAQADLAALYDGLKSAHHDLYANRSQREYDALYAQTAAALEGAALSRFALFLQLQKFTAYGDVAHARIDFPGEVYDAYRADGGKAFPIYLRIVDGRAYVGEDYSGVSEIAPGDEILAIDGEPMARWLDRAAAYISADTPYIAHSLLEFSFPQYLWVLAGARDDYDLKLRAGDASVKSVRIPALDRTALQDAIAAAPSAFSLNGAARLAEMATDDIAYLRPGPFYNAENPDRIWDNVGFAAFIDSAFETFIAAGAQSLVIDLRNNPGGDNSFSDVMIAWFADRPFRFASRFVVRSSDEAAAANQARLDASPDAVSGVSGLYAKAFAETLRGETFDFEIPLARPREGRRFTGDVYVLVNRHSYSNAVNVAAIVQDYGWGVIAGEPTADFATTYGAMERFSLPHTGFSVGFPKALIIRPSGDERPGGVAPDIAIETPIAAVSDDVVLNRLVDLVRGE